MVNIAKAKVSRVYQYSRGRLSGTIFTCSWTIKLRLPRDMFPCWLRSSNIQFLPDWPDS